MIFFKVNIIQLLLISVSALNGSCHKAQADKNFGTTLEYPINLNVEFNEKTESSFLSWDEVKGADGYTIWFSYSETSNYTLLADVVNTEYTDYTIKRSRETYYKVKSYNTFTTSMFGVPVSVKNTLPGNGVRWDFDTLDGWVDGSQNMDGIINYSITDGILNIFTRANTWDRPKVRTKDKIYKEGRYTWRVFIPEMGMGDMASIGAFLYDDDSHELDFEIGYGTSEVRKKLDAQSDDLIVYTTSQANPYMSSTRTIKRKHWYKLEIELLKSQSNYEAIWYIDDVEVERVNLNYGKQSFYIFCSVENLTFLGDHIPNQSNFGLFDYVEYK